MVIELAKPYDEEEAKRMMARAQYTPRPVQVEKQSNPLMDVAKSAGSSILGKASEAAGTKALGKLGTAFAQGKYGAAVTGANPLMGGLMAAGSTALPFLAGAAVLGKVFKLFNSGGPVGPLNAQYKEEGGPALEDDPLFTEWAGLYDDMNSGIIEPSYPRLVELEAMLQRKYGGETQYKKHGGMTKLSGPLSNNKSVKMERKETIEYKN